MFSAFKCSEYKFAQGLWQIKGIKSEEKRGPTKVESCLDKNSVRKELKVDERLSWVTVHNRIYGDPLLSQRKKKIIKTLAELNMSFNCEGCKQK